MAMFCRWRIAFGVDQRLILSLLATLSCVTGIEAQSQATKLGVRTVARAGIGPYANFNSFSFPVINDLGNVTFKSDSAVFSETGNIGLREVAKLNDSAPGVPGAVFSDIFTQAPSTGNQGTVAFQGISKAGTTQRQGIWTQQGTGSLELLAGVDNPAPGASAGVTFRDFSQPNISQEGQVAIQARVKGTGITSSVNDQGVWAQKTVGGPLQLVAMAGQSTPGMAAVFDGFFGKPTNNSAGDVAFVSRTTAAPSRRYGIWADTSGSGLTLRVAQGSPVPGLSPTQQLADIDSLNLSINEASRIVFHGQLAGSGITSDNDGVLLAETSSGFRIALQEGQTISGLPSGQVLRDSFRGVMNSMGEITGVSYLTGTGVTSDNSTVLLSEVGGGGLRIVARDGDQIPGLTPGVQYSYIIGNGDYKINDNGVIVFSSNLTGVGVGSGNNEAYFAEVSPGVIKTVVRTGDLLEVAPSVFKTVNGISTSGFRGDYLNNNDEFTFVANFTDSTQGVFVVNVSAVPEVGSGTLLAIAALMGIVVNRKAKRAV